MERTRSMSREHLIDECTASPVGRAALRAANDAGALETVETARQEFHTQIIELADAYDSMGHRLGGGGDSALDNDAHSLRRFVREELHISL